MTPLSRFSGTTHFPLEFSGIKGVPDSGHSIRIPSFADTRLVPSHRSPPSDTKSQRQDEVQLRRHPDSLPPSPRGLQHRRTGHQTEVGKSCWLPVLFPGTRTVTLLSPSAPMPDSMWRPSHRGAEEGPRTQGLTIVAIHNTGPQRHNWTRTDIRLTRHNPLPAFPPIFF